MGSILQHLEAQRKYLEDKFFPPAPFPLRLLSDSLESFDDDPLAWSRPREWHHRGEFSMAAVQSYQDIEDHSQVDVGGDHELFVGVYDGYKGDAAALYIRENVFPALLRRIRANHNNMTENIMRQVIEEMETRFMAFAATNYLENQQSQIGLVSSGCLICIIWNGTLYLGNVGDSLAVLGSKKGFFPFKRLGAKLMLRNHSCDNLEIRNELARLHPGEGQICNRVGEKHYVKGLSETSRCIGYAYMKMAPFTQMSSFQIPPQEQVTQPYTQSLLSSEPEVYSRVLKEKDRFIIFGSYGFWKLITPKEAAKFANTLPRVGIAKTLVTIALENVAIRRGRSYRDLIGMPRGNYVSGRGANIQDGFRPYYHDDITVIVVYLDKKPIRDGVEVQIKSCRGNDDAIRQSAFVDFYHNQPLP